ncbi:hypothetical protein [Rhizobium sp. 007]|uniref:lipase family alpha/beta hydrolase n=1 Tax=Rhizobium sp. 007 TaxID=2785056 RepID=UPI00188FCFC6|nr:hypothetical protein [Rhizobium sp. 007]QPB24226.1 hypothetical protein ISN39_32070 [Rhizobium sp. 007]
MDVVVFVPGTMGTVLKTPGGEEVWPPTALETQFGYKRKAELMREDLVVGGVVRKVLCFGVYQPLLDQLAEIGFTESGAAKRLVPFPYDWRLDLEGSADRLAAKLSDLVAHGATSITIVAHSMGGLISRLVMESSKFQDEPWHGKINGFLALATPHLGAPLALARILGMDSALGISAEDFKELANDRRYPSGYQLLPAPAEASCWDISRLEIDPLDIYDDHVAAQLGLDKTLLARARLVHDTLAAGRQPDHVRYFYFAGTGHKTATRVNIDGSERLLTVSEDAGDGTVPMWSALPKSGQKQFVVGEHASFFTSRIFKPVFYNLLGKDYPEPPVHAASTLDLSVHAILVKQTDAIELLLIPSFPTREIEGALKIERTDDEAKPFVPFKDPIAVTYKGPLVPQLKLLLDPTGEPGLYRIKFNGRPGGSSVVQFAVSDK